MNRLSSGGQIDRAKSVPFSFDGVDYLAHPGDTLASALLVNNVRLVGRSFKYHRPRGILTAGSEEPNALVEIGLGADIRPNTRATTQEVYAGMVANSQNRFPSLKLDLLSVNDFLSPFLGAGFYYKTFMWPAAFWEKIYEPIIRRAAGLGSLSGQPDTAIYQKAWAHCDLLVIGSGPAGLIAAKLAAKAGAKIILADEDFTFGGRLNSETIEVDGQSGANWAKEVVEELATMPNVTLMNRTTITGAYDGGTYGALERVSEHIGNSGNAPEQIFWRIVAKKVVLAAGATERPIAFPDNDRPGIMMASAVRSYVNRFAVSTGKNVAVFCNNDDGWRTVYDLRAAGINVAALIDTREDVSPDVDCPVYSGASVIATKGRLALRGIKIRTSDGSVKSLDVDCLAVSGGWNPNVHLTGHMGGKPEWHEDIAAFAPKPDLIPGMQAAGSANGVFSTHDALSQGLAAAKGALKSLGLKQPRLSVPTAEDAPVNITPFWFVDDKAGKSRAWLDFQHDVTIKDIKLAHRENFRAVEHLKRYTTIGMATDQGKLSNMGGLAVMAELTGQSIPETGTTIFRPPYTPINIGALGAGGAGNGFAPDRMLPSHNWMGEQDAPTLEVGLWHRPAWFTEKGETHWRQSCDREVNMVREHVGICDVSTLGKIDIQGSDAGAFLDRVYTNVFSSLKVGKVRYGVMLREDGFVLDDGTTACLAENHYLMTTTTAAAGPVMSHLEFCLQVLWPDLDVHVTSVTDQWAQIAVAGPKSRELLAGLINDVSNETFPFMGCGEVRIGGVSGRLFRISFSGELAYEIAVPASYGDHLMRELVARAKKLGGGPYGMEALNVLRLEKGFLTHAEMDGRVTADDLGLGGMMSTKKEYIGRISSNRAAMHESNREQLVGLRPKTVIKQLLGGSLMFDVDADPVRVNMQGHMTSVCYSPTLGGMIGLGMLKGGRARIGQEIRVVDLLRNTDTLCEIVEPQFFDAKGERLRG